jgi:hypothetical protein
VTDMCANEKNLSAPNCESGVLLDDVQDDEDVPGVWLDSSA